MGGHGLVIVNLGLLDILSDFGEGFIDAMETLNKFDAKIAIMTYNNKSHYGPAAVNIYQWKGDGTRIKVAGPIEVKK